MNKQFMVIWVLFICISGCEHTNKITETKPQLTHSEIEMWRLMVGKWYGNQPANNGGRSEIITERRSDGTYKNMFRIHDPVHGVTESTEVGQWGMSGSIYFTILHGWIEGDKFYPTDSVTPYYQDAYRIIELNEEVIEYEHVTVKGIFVSKKVPLDFEFPEVDTGLKQ